MFIKNVAPKPLVLLAMIVLLVQAQSPVSMVDDTQHKMAVAHVFNQARERCYSSPECPNRDELMALFTPDARRTEINRQNNVIQLEGLEALRADSLRVAQTFTGRRLETTSVSNQGRNVIFLQWNWDPAAPSPNPFTHLLRIQDGRIAHWILLAP